ncbi:hypothetical protein H7J87_12275 [Mycolicibacterium wolinskyi]|uniref:Uncharacterized protein n=1 Tax=Mycolicibacterium wolinskyi TaxID=59750 RepID=A0A1X2FJG1_9MYCO|nr:MULTISPECIES: hypothetical protein [Mycolicibacterium]MCV7286106.1 hypothetical protein [Mycolicibacterium wolinskyi]MCV7296302.1 hypothetical protein [Mycolicibacterium goodii]ORX18527.1 hypothetical protein AWC31_14605 [Mycolicibacterium wolinskyi]
MMTVDETAWPALTAADFQMHDHTSERTLPFIEDEFGNGVYGYGHWDKAEFAAAVNEYDRRHGADHADDEERTASDVAHAWAVVTDPDTQRFTWSDVTAESPNAFPVTVIQR